jgi:TorA maturation chaperone TorD
MVGDRELLAFRRGYYDLLVSLLWREPTAAMLAGLATGIEERAHAARTVHPLLGEGWEQMERALAGTAAAPLVDAVAAEYTRLFIGPAAPEIQPYESYYLTGRLLDRPLVAIRIFLRDLGIEKEATYAEPEDFLAFELEVMRTLLGRQHSASGAEEETRSIGHQAAFLQRHLLVWAPAAAADLAKVSDAPFYQAVAKVLQGFLELEREVLREWGSASPMSLEDARRSLAHTGEWSGPLLEVTLESRRTDAKV